MFLKLWCITGNEYVLLHPSLVGSKMLLYEPRLPRVQSVTQGSTQGRSSSLDLVQDGG